MLIKIGLGNGSIWFEQGMSSKNMGTYVNISLKILMYQIQFRDMDTEVFAMLH